MILRLEKSILCGVGIIILLCGIGWISNVLHEEVGQTQGMSQEQEPSDQPVEVYHVGNGVSAPVALYKKEPEYSEEAREARVQGVVVVYALIETDGTVSGGRISKSLGFGLDEKAIEAVGRWKFAPAYKDGKPVPVEAMIEINFRLK